jgi:hypothetical protein
MASEATAGTAAAMIIRMDKKASSNGSIAIHHLHKMRKGEARSECDGKKKMHNVVLSILEEAVMTADSLGDRTQLLKWLRILSAVKQSGTAETLKAVTESPGAQP